MVRQEAWRGPPPIEILQRPGETVYVPAGWWHVVINLDPTVAVTQNSGEVANLALIDAEIAAKRPDIHDEWAGLVEPLLAPARA